MSRRLWIWILGPVACITVAGQAWAQSNPHIGFVYPAGGQRGTTVTVRLGGQRLTGLGGGIVSGEGVRVKLVEYRRRLSNQDRRFLQEQVKELKALQKKSGGRGKKKGDKEQPAMMEMMAEDMMMSEAKPGERKTPAMRDNAARELMARVQTRLSEYCNRPANASLADIALLEVTIDPKAKPGSRDIRLMTDKGISNPLVFHVGQFGETTRKPMKTQPVQVLGKEYLAQRKRPVEEEEVTVSLPCTMNGQIASGEVNRYRFKARKGQRLVISVAARSLIPYIADAVPGWFQPVLTLSDANGREVAFNDDFRFKPDPTLFHEVARDGEYILSINDAIYRGREDFVYRITVGDVPFVSGIFPLGRRVGETRKVKMSGWNLEGARLHLPPEKAEVGVHHVVAQRKGLSSNPVPFAVDDLPECFEEEPNDDVKGAQRVPMPMIVNGRMNEAGDGDVFRIEGKAGATLVAEVHARRLDSPMDSVVMVLDGAGKPLAVNDDRSDPGSGLNTHHADSYVMVTLPRDGAYYVRVGDAERKHGEAYAYRLRISPPRPDFELRVVPSSVSVRGKAAGGVNVYAIRKDGFSGPIKLALANPPEGITAPVVTLGAGKEKARFTVKTQLKRAAEPFRLDLKGTAKMGERIVEHVAVPAEDNMQAFLWRHLVPAKSFLARVHDPGYKPGDKRPVPVVPEKKIAEDGGKPTAAPKFSKKQLEGLLKQLKRLHGEWLLTDEFYVKKITEYNKAL